MEIIPGINEKEWSEIEKKLEVVKPLSRWVHIDLIDGKFAENTTFLDPTPFKKYTDSLFLEAHMMVENPEEYIEPLAKAGFRRFIGQVEKMPDQVSFVAKAQLWGEVGLGLDLATPLDAITVSFEDLDFLTIMTVKAGFSGQEFQGKALEKCQALRQRTGLPIEIDGGVTDKTIVRAKELGVNRAVATSFLFASPDLGKQFRLLSSSAENQNA